MAIAGCRNDVRLARKCSGDFLPPSPPAEKARECLASGSGLAPPSTDTQVIAGTILGIAGMAIDASIHRRHW
jgi:hypothetical protein